MLCYSGRPICYGPVSVCPSVHLFVTGRYSIKMAKYVSEEIIRMIAHGLKFSDAKRLEIPAGSPQTRAIHTRAVGKICDFQQIIRYTSKRYNTWHGKVDTEQEVICALSNGDIAHDLEWLILTTQSTPICAFWVFLHIFGTAEARHLTDRTWLPISYPAIVTVSLHSDCVKLVSFLKPPLKQLHWLPVERRITYRLYLHMHLIHIGGGLGGWMVTYWNRIEKGPGFKSWRGYHKIIFFKIAMSSDGVCKYLPHIIWSCALFLYACCCCFDLY